MVKNIFLFTGEEKYLLYQELKRRKDSFVEKFSKDALFVFDTEHFALDYVRQILYGGSLFVQKKMIILYGLPLDGDISNKLSSDLVQQFVDECIQKYEQIDPETILIFVSYKPDKRTKFFTFLKEHATQKQFDPLNPGELKNFVRQHSSSLMRTDDVLEYFLSKTGSDLFHIINECEKLSLFASFRGIPSVDIALINLISFGFVEGNSFAFFDLLFVDKKKSLELIEEAQEEGINRNLFIGTLYRGCKLRLFTIDLYEQGITDPKTLASTLKAHPFVVSKIVKHIEVISRNKNPIISFYRGLVELDVAIKSGKMSDFNFWLHIKKMVITLF